MLDPVVELLTVLQGVQQVLVSDPLQLVHGRGKAVVFLLRKFLQLRMVGCDLLVLLPTLHRGVVLDTTVNLFPDLCGKITLLPDSFDCRFMMTARSILNFHCRVIMTVRCTLSFVCLIQDSLS